MGCTCTAECTSLDSGAFDFITIMLVFPGGGASARWGCTLHVKGSDHARLPVGKQSPPFFLRDLMGERDGAQLAAISQTAAESKQ